jgi:glycosyltransferase involved in cell wall biosynthesis
MDIHRKPLISIIIPTYKSVKTLKLVLESIKNQTYDNIEVIVVDRPSCDGTEQLVKKFGYKYIAFNSERTKAVNHGAKISSGDFIYYIGSDYVLEANLIEKVVKTVLKEGADAAIIQNLVLPTGFWSKVKWLEKECYKGDDLVEAARFFSRKAFFDVGGYDEEMVAYEEHDLHNRLLEKGYKIVRVSGVKEINIGEPNSLWLYARKYYYYGKTVGKYLRKYPKKSLVQLSPIRPSYLRCWKKFIRYPILTLGFAVYQAVRYFSAVLGLLISKVEK